MKKKKKHHLQKAHQGELHHIQCNFDLMLYLNPNELAWLLQKQNWETLRWKIYCWLDKKCRPHRAAE